MVLQQVLIQDQSMEVWSSCSQASCSSFQITWETADLGLQNMISPFNSSGETPSYDVSTTKVEADEAYRKIPWAKIWQPESQRWASLNRQNASFETLPF